MKKQSFLFLIVGVVLGFCLASARPVKGQRLEEILKATAILLLIDRFHADIDKFVNEVTGNHPDAAEIATDVVPILSVGNGTYAGAVQVSGPKDRVDSVRACAQIEGEKKIAGKTIRVRVLVPISDRNVKDKNKLSRVKGVGSSALVDARL